MAEYLKCIKSATVAVLDVSGLITSRGTFFFAVQLLLPAREDYKPYAVME